MLPCLLPDWPAPANVLALTTTRQGGVSQPPWDSLNLGDHVGDDPQAVEANRGTLQSLLPAGSRIQWLEQVHGTRAVPAGADASFPPRADVSFPPQADACWTREPGLACAVLTADCLPVLLCDRAGSVVASVHAGWRGLVAGVIEQTVAAMSAEPGQLLAWLGPAIGPATFEVGPEVREAFCQAPGANALEHACFRVSALAADHWVADIYALARLRLRRLGIQAVYGGGFCTVRDPLRFYSFRRDGQTGRMASLIQLR